MKAEVLKNSLAISLLGHLVVFSIFSFSFGRVIPKQDFAPVTFWGQCLRASQVTAPSEIAHKFSAPWALIRQHQALQLTKPSEDFSLPERYFVKPPLAFSMSQEKAEFRQEPSQFLFAPFRKEPAIMFHPLLPNSFPLYFRDRQIAHVELMYNIVSSGQRSSVYVKRKISSGNLEVDLLTSRYIERYLFIQQARFIPNNWQTVKIDLSAKND